MNPSKLKQHALAVTLAGFVFGSLPAAAEPVAGDQWAFAVTPYLWLPNINGTLKFQLPNRGSAGVETGCGKEEVSQFTARGNVTHFRRNAGAPF